MNLGYFWTHFTMEILLIINICYFLIIYLLNKLEYMKITIEEVIIVCIYTIFVSLYAFNLVAEFNENITVFILNNYFVENIFIYKIKYIILISYIIFLILLKNFNKIIKLPIYEYIIITLTCLLGLCMIITSNHLFIIFLFLELVNLCIYCLIGLNKNSNLGIEIAYKYFVQSSFATIVGFFGISLIYAVTGTLFLNELNIFCSFENKNIFFILGIFLIFLSVFFKLGVFPLHGWMPDLYQGALLISVIFISIIPKIAYITLFFKLYTELHMVINNYCILIILISIIYGAVVAIYQTSFKRLLAYSSMFHIGLILYSITLFTINSITSAFFYLLVYITLMFFIFSFMFLIFEKNKNQLTYIDNISQLIYIFNSNKLLSYYFIFFMLSLAGLPFFIGFISKWYIFISLINSHKYLELFLLLSASVFSSAYYIRLIRFLIFLNEKNNKVQTFNTIQFDETFYYLLNFLLIINIFLILFHNILYLYIFKLIIIIFL